MNAPESRKADFVTAVLASRPFRRHGCFGVTAVLASRPLSPIDHLVDRPAGVRVARREPPCVPHPRLLPAGGEERLRERQMLEYDEGAVRLTPEGLLRVDQLLPEFYARKYQNARYT